MSIEIDLRDRPRLVTKEVRDLEVGEIFEFVDTGALRYVVLTNQETSLVCMVLQSENIFVMAKGAREVEILDQAEVQIRISNQEY